MLREKKISAQASMWIATDAIEAMPSIPFYRRLKMALDAAGFGDQVRELCRPYYADGVGAPGIDPEVFFKASMPSARTRKCRTTNGNTSTTRTRASGR